MTDYSLPDLPYDYAALEPYISGQIMELHHDKHHATYVKGINTAVEQLAEAREQESFGNLTTLEKNLAFHLGGHVNHSVFWPNMSPDGGDKPTGETGPDGRGALRSFDAFRAHFTPTRSRCRARAGRSWPGTSRPAAVHRAALRPPGQPPDVPGPAADARHVGARLLPDYQNDKAHLRRPVVERRQLGRRPGPLRARQAPRPWR